VSYAHKNRKLFGEFLLSAYIFAILVCKGEKYGLKSVLNPTYFLVASAVQR
jgi:hypothetical protein